MITVTCAAREEVFDPGGGSAAGGPRPPWALTGVKDPADEDTLYGKDHVVPGGRARARVTPSPSGRPGRAYDEVVRQLENEGIARFVDAGPQPLDAVTAASDSKGVDAE
ncbi:hypothetical protein ABZ368_30210 [Streptomyces sp. NPDC005908]|uniref:hypothetical protein n=1 Tax=unclassified Streptomyces TaxID=2593676 RepID=UPI0011A2A193|nr:hypothetical protein [Streptomyces sp. T12]TWD23956.1 hypothetical protein FB570_10481 [Streptomyces sp. T12]